MIWASCYMPSMVFGVFLRAICTFKTLNCTVAYGLWGDFWHLGGHGPLAPPPKSAYVHGTAGHLSKKVLHCFPLIYTLTYWWLSSASAFYCSMYFTLCFALRIKWWWWWWWLASSFNIVYCSATLYSKRCRHHDLLEIWLSCRRRPPE